jgi:hypothetical protein
VTDVAQPPKTALEIILEWSSGRPAWQRDALRRIVQAQKLTETDIIELVALCKRGRTEKPLAADPEPNPLEANHLPANPGAGASVALTAVKDVSAVNNLAPGQILSFAPVGIAGVYGDNGAGKSGYARILKRACRARHSEAILPNVYDEPATTSASATLCYSIGGVEQAPDAWTDTGHSEPQPHSVLSAISVFDGDCAAVHLKGKNEVAFRPFGLDIPDELGNACKQVKAQLDAEKKQLEAIRNAVFTAPPWSAATAVGRALTKLTHATNLAVIEGLATLTDQEQARLNRLTEDLSKNPATAAAEQKLKADRIKRLADTLAVIAARTADDALTNLLTLHGDAAAKRAAARLAAQGLFGTDSLPDVGGEVWRTLWDAARRYSTEVAYPAAPFPPLRPEMLCVLCHQPLSIEAIQRMKRFETFIKDDTEHQAQESENKFRSVISTLTDLVIRLRPIAESLGEVELHDKPLARIIRRALASARLRRHATLRRVVGHEHAAIPAAEPFPSVALATMETEIQKYAADLQKAATGGERIALQAERQELADRATLNTHMAAVKAEIARVQAIRFLDTCITDTATNAITTLGNKIADQVLTPRLRDRFAAEIIELVGVNVRVEMVRVGGQYGSPQYQIRLLARPDAKVAQILSEGEQTCVAIAAFLAELATAPHNSALVFDDPITSLDHKWRHRVAERLVAEAAVRQVIVFTHDLIFLNDIQDAAKRTPCETRHIRRSATTIGMVNTDLPWDGMKVAERVDNLEKRARALMAVRAREDEETYKREARHFYDDLRAAWERALEEVAFAHVVMRHRDYIRGRDLLRVSALTAQDCNSWTDSFGNCCDLIAGHDGSRGRNRAMPEPEELLQDTQALGAWVRDLKDRQKAIQG